MNKRRHHHLERLLDVVCPAGLEVAVGAPVHLLLQGAVSAAAGHHHHHHQAPGPHLWCWHLISSRGRVWLNTQYSQYSNLVLKRVKISDSCRCLSSVQWRVMEQGYLTTSQMLTVRLYITNVPCNHFCHYLCFQSQHTGVLFQISRPQYRPSLPGGPLATGGKMRCTQRPPVRAAAASRAGAAHLMRKTAELYLLL